MIDRQIGDKLTAYNPSNRSSRDYTITAYERLGEGNETGCENKYKVSVKPWDSDERYVKEFKFVEKESEFCRPEKFYNYWQVLNRASIPTIPGIRITKEDTVLMLDVTADGSKLYGDEISATYKFRDHTIVDDIYYAIPHTEVLAEANRIIKLATDNSVQLPADIFKVWIRPTRLWTLLAWDFGDMSIRTNPHNSLLSNFVADFLQSAQYQIGSYYKIKEECKNDPEKWYQWTKPKKYKWTGL